MAGEPKLSEPFLRPAAFPRGALCRHYAAHALALGIFLVCEGVMCSYNAENGRPSCANDFILNKQLRSWKPATVLQGGGG